MLISYNKVCAMYNALIVGTPPSPLLKGGGGRTFQNESLGGGILNFLLERGDKPKRGRVGGGLI